MNTPIDRLGGHPVPIVHEEGPTDIVVLVHAFGVGKLLYTGKLALVIKDGAGSVPKCLRYLSIPVFDSILDVLLLSICPKHIFKSP